MAVSLETGRRAYNAAYMRSYRARKKKDEEPVAPVIEAPENPIDALAAWSESTLVVPAGHPNAGKPLVIPEYGLRFLADALTHRYSLLSVARKNAKSAIIAVYLLARLCGPLRVEGWRGGVCSVNREKAGELKRQMEDISKASGLHDVTVWKAPVIESATGRLDILSADKSAGAASGFDDALVDELGLLYEKDRELVNGMRAAISARDGRFIALSIMGKGPFCRELVEQKDDPAVCVHVYQADTDAALDDPKQWRKANPGLQAGIKSLAYMQDESRRVLAVASDQNDFRAQELNMPVDPGKEMIVSLTDFQHCLNDAERDGHVVIGFDAGGSSSMTALVAYWPWTGRLEVYGAFGDDPDLLTRGQSDGVNDLYVRLYDKGELSIYSGKVTPVGLFLSDCLERLDGQTIMAAGADRFRRAEVETALEQAGLDLPMTWRGTGAHKVADGSHDCRALQRAVLKHQLKVTTGAGLLAHAISESSLRYDAGGNPALCKARDKGRIDCLQAGVIACGLGELVAAKGKPEPAKFAVVA